MARKAYGPEQIIAMLREADLALGQPPRPIDAAAFPPESFHVGGRFQCSRGERCCPTISKPLVASQGALAYGSAAALHKRL